MPDEPMRHYLLTTLEAELLACFRLLDPKTRDAVTFMIASQTNHERRTLDNPLVLQLVQS